MRVLYTRKPWNPGSWIIRWALPASRLRWARASHSLIVDGEYAIEAIMGTIRRVDSWFPWRLGGVRRVPLSKALRGSKIVRDVVYHLQDEQGAMEFARSLEGLPYDFGGAIGLALGDGEKFHDLSALFCHELVASVGRRGGWRFLAEDSRITDTILLALAPGEI